MDSRSKSSRNTTSVPPQYTDLKQIYRQGQSRTQKGNLAKARAKLKADVSSTHPAPQNPPDSPRKPLRDRISVLEAENDGLRDENGALKRKLGVEKQGRRRARKTIDALRSGNSEQSYGLRACRNDLIDVRLSLTHSQNEIRVLQARLAGDDGRVAGLRERLEKALKRNRALEKQRLRAKGVLEHAIEHTRRQTQQKTSHFALFRRGVYSRPARAMARMLICSGTSEKNVGGVIQAIGTMMGKKVDRKMSERTAGRCMTEGGLAAEMQLAKEMMDTSDLTSSSDGTGHRHIEYISRAVSYKVDGERKMRTLGIHSATDKSAQTQLDDLKTLLDKFADVWNASPAAQRSKLVFTKDVYAEKVRGANGDHAKDQKKYSELLQAWKDFVRDHKLGWAKIAALSVEALTQMLTAVKEEVIELRGGISAYMHMSMEEIHAMDLEILDILVVRLGGEEYEKMSPEERKAFGLFVWGGCCMHKDLNTVKGGDKAMQAYWDDNALIGPVTLANKQNTAILANVSSDADPTEIELRAAMSSHRGGAWAALLGGKILANDDEKKGQHDTFANFTVAKTGKRRLYPGTSTTRFQSTCDAAEFLLEWTEILVEFMDIVRHRKDTPGLTNIELNFEKALTDLPTITEWVVLALISQCFSHPYMRYVRGPGTVNVNHLDLGPLHQKLIAFIEKLIADPDILLDNPTGEKSTFDGHKFDNPSVIEKIKVLIPTLPSSEFAQGGIIDGLTTEEREQAWLPATNDHNEGALGWMRVTLRRRPRLTVHQMNARFLYERNETHAWMEKNLTEEDDKYLRTLARRYQQSRPDLKRRQELYLADETNVAAKRQKIADTKRKEAEKIDALYDVQLVFAKDDVLKLNVGKIKEQLAVWRKWDKDVGKVGELSGTGPEGQKQRQIALLAAIERANGKDPRPPRNSSA
ncbi:hypothetical protein C8F01DRAFT_1092374 [Mycena amicta]|nr:hypothetical protein C8F01DRAFT_1092374 [Mycena amicta]